MNGFERSPLVLSTVDDLRAIVGEELDRRLGPVLEALGHRPVPEAPTADAGGMLSRAELARLLGVNARTLRRMALAGELPAPMRIGKRSVRWSRGAITAWIDSRQGAT